RHPGEVAGLVLVDSLHEDQFECCSPHFPPPADGEPPALTSMRAFWSGGWRAPASNPEGIDLPACRDAAHAVKSLGDLPLRVLTASGFTLPSAAFGRAAARLQTIWDNLQAQLAALSADSHRQVLAGTGHFVQNERPEAIVQAIREVVASARRSPGSASGPPL
ncbi:MAG: alpha/beta fold hydrolase, partial [Ramlibacter sp.]